ncbi:Crp/Fnr family transcriptional regulator [Gammaproteobacteria bacterium]
MSFVPVVPGRREVWRRFVRLSPTDQATVVAFIDFLASRATPPPESVPAPQVPEDIPRPAQETVIAAIRRLSARYPMLERDVLLDRASSLMTEHLLQGRTASSAIDELERLFATQYQSYLDSFSQTLSQGAPCPPKAPSD